MLDQDLFLEQALLESEAISPDQLEAARQRARERDITVSQALLDAEVVTSRVLALAKADVCESPFIDLSAYEPCFSNTQMLPRTVAERYGAFPLFMIDNVLTVAMIDPLNLEAVDQVRQIAKCDVETVLAEPDKIQTLIGRSYSLSYGQGDHGGVDAQSSAAQRSSMRPSRSWPRSTRYSPTPPNRGRATSTSIPTSAISTSGIGSTAYFTPGRDRPARCTRDSCSGSR